MSEVQKEGEWLKLLSRPRSKFLRVKCLKCGNEQITFSHATTKVRCMICEEILVEPAGGKARVRGEIVGTLE